MSSMSSQASAPEGLTKLKMQRPDVRLVGENLFHRGVCLCRSADELREVISPAEFCPVALGRSEPDCELHSRSDENAAALERTERSEHLAIHAVVVDGGDTTNEISFQALSKIVHGVGTGCIEMGVQIEEPWHK